MQKNFYKLNKERQLVQWELLRLATLINCGDLWLLGFLHFMPSGFFLSRRYILFLKYPISGSVYVTDITAFTNVAYSNQGGNQVNIEYGAFLFKGLNMTIVSYSTSVN